jgi:sugar-specific transcriptional regulator TrmB
MRASLLRRSVRDKEELRNIYLCRGKATTIIKYLCGYRSVVADIDGALRAWGLNAKESKVYLTLLEFGEATATRLSESSGINRTTMYDLLFGLGRKGIVGAVRKGHILFFHASPPETLVSSFAKRLERVREAVPELKARMSIIGKRPTVDFYEGRGGLLRIYQDILATGKPVVSYGSFAISERASKHVTQDYRKQRIARNISTKVITDRSITKIPLFNDKKYHRLTEIYIDDSFKSFPTWLYVYGDKVAVISREKERVFGFIIESKSLAQAERFIFKRMILGARKYVPRA